MQVYSTTKAGRIQEILTIITTSESVSTSVLQKKLQTQGMHVSQKTLQRDIQMLLEQKIITQIGKGRSTKYVVQMSNTVFTPIVIEEYFSVNYEERTVQSAFNFGVFDLLQQNLFTSSEAKHLTALHTTFIKNFSGYTSQTIINKEFERILIEFSWKSSQIEGNTYSLLSTERLIKDNIPEAGKTKEETQMILNHKDAFNEILQHKTDFLQLHAMNVKHIHRILTKELTISPNFRSHPVGITGTKYRPLDNVHQITEGFNAMITLVNSHNSFFEKSFLVLLLISYIQAFEDGNKRTARMTSNAVLLAFNTIPMSYRAVDEVEYKKASILFYEQNNITYFKEIFIEQYAFAVRNYFL